MKTYELKRSNGVLIVFATPILTRKSVKISMFLRENTVIFFLQYYIKHAFHRLNMHFVDVLTSGYIVKLLVLHR